jgi:hypothetical protein
VSLSHSTVGSRRTGAVFCLVLSALSNLSTQQAYTKYLLNKRVKDVHDGLQNAPTLSGLHRRLGALQIFRCYLKQWSAVREVTEIPRGLRALFFKSSDIPVFFSSMPSTVASREHVLPSLTITVVPY